jgi:hypothetical protein
MSGSGLFIFKTFVLLMIIISSAFSYAPQFADREQKFRLHWPERKIPIAISKSLLDNKINIKARSDILNALQNSFRHWEDAANIEFEYTFSDQDGISAKGSDGDGISLITIAPTTENLLVFDERINDTSAVTRLFYNTKGAIKEADIVLNPVLLFTTDGTFGTFDLEATLTHEIGHLLGLGHSRIIGATMHSHQGENGVYNLPNYGSRTLSEDDKAGVISLYGSRSDKENCCAQIDGRINASGIREKQQLHIWAEESGSGKISAGILSDSEGTFTLRGLVRSVYNVYAQSAEGDSTVVSLGEVDLVNRAQKTLNKEIKLEVKNFEAQYLGFNGQLASLAVPVNAGKSYMIFVGGQNLRPEDFEIGFHSENFKVSQKSIRSHEYGSDLSVFSFVVEISEQTPIGEYSFYLKTSDDKMEHLIGGLTVEETVNPWNSKLF